MGGQSRSHSGGCSKSTEVLGALAELGLAECATMHDIKRAFHRLALKHHPDKGGEPDRFAAINEAHRILTDPKLNPPADTKHCKKKQRKAPGHHGTKTKMVTEEVWVRHTLFRTEEQVIEDRNRRMFEEGKEAEAARRRQANFSSLNSFEDAETKESRKRETAAKNALSSSWASHAQRKAEIAEAERRKEEERRAAAAAQKRAREESAAPRLAMMAEKREQERAALLTAPQPHPVQPRPATVEEVPDPEAPPPSFNTVVASSETKPSTPVKPAYTRENDQVIHDLRAGLELMTARAMSAERQASALQSRISKKRGSDDNIEKLSAQVKNGEDVHRRLREKIASLEKANSDARRKIAACEGTIASLKNSKAKNTLDIPLLDNDAMMECFLEYMSVYLEPIREQNEVLQRTETTLQARIAVLEEEKLALTNTNATLRDARIDTRNELRTAQSTIRDLSVQLQATKEKAAAAQEKATTLAQDLQKAHHDLAASEKRADALAAEQEGATARSVFIIIVLATVVFVTL